MDGTYWDKAVETIDWADLKKLQLERFNTILGKAVCSRFTADACPLK